MSRRYATEKTLCQSKIGQGLSALIGASAIGAASAVFTGELVIVLCYKNGFSPLTDKELRRLNSL